MKYGVCLFLALLINGLLFLWMHALVQRQQTLTRAEDKQKKESLKLAAPQPIPKPQPKTPPKPLSKAAPLAKMPAAPAMALPKMPTLSASAMPSALAMPAPSQPSLGPMSVRGRMWKGAAPAPSGAVGQGTGRGQGQGQAQAAQPAPAPTLKVPPRYPPNAAREGIEGQVKVEFVIGEKGRPTQVRAVSSTPPDLFDKAAVRAVRKWKFPPQPQPLRSFVTLEFKMEQLR